MTGVREHFSDLRVREVRMEIALGDDRACQSCMGLAQLLFGEMSLPPISFTDVLVCPWDEEEL
jgi:hypothetical protein